MRRYSECPSRSITNIYITYFSCGLVGVSTGTISPSLNSTTTARTITVTSPTTFTATSVNCTVAPDATGLANAHVSPVIYNNGSTAPTDAEKRDRLRAIIHLILTSPDYTIQR